VHLAACLAVNLVARKVDWKAARLDSLLAVHLAASSVVLSVVLLVDKKAVTSDVLLVVR